jgi:hypothetical protein
MLGTQPKALVLDQGSQGWAMAFSHQRFNVLTPSNLTRLQRILPAYKNLSMQELLHKTESPVSSASVPGKKFFSDDTLPTNPSHSLVETDNRISN